MKKFYWAAFFGNWSFATGILIFHYRILGFSFIQIFLLAAIYEGLNFILEIPTGILADIWGYKKTVILGCLISALSFFIVLLNSDIYASYVIWAVLSAICTTLNSGTYDAFIYESVQCQEAINYSKVLGTIRFISFGTQAVCIILGGLFSDWIGFNLALFLSGVGGMIQTAILFSMKDIETGKHKIDKWTSDLQIRILTIIKSSWGEIKKSDELRQIFVIGLLIFLVLQYANTIFQPFLESVGYHSHIRIALFSAASMLIMAVGAKVTACMDRVTGSDQQKIVIILFLMCLPLFFLFSKISGLFAFGFLFLVSGMGDVLYLSMMNQRIPSEIRATLLSFQNQLFSILYAIAAIGFGFLLEKTDIALASMVIAMLLILTLLSYSTFNKYLKIIN